MSLSKQGNHCTKKVQHFDYSTLRMISNLVTHHYQTIFGKVSRPLTFPTTRENSELRITLAQTEHAGNIYLCSYSSMHLPFLLSQFLIYNNIVLKSHVVNSRKEFLPLAKYSFQNGFTFNLTISLQKPIYISLTQK